MNVAAISELCNNALSDYQNLWNRVDTSLRSPDWTIV